MAGAQAKEFADNWSVVDQIPDTGSGFSATIFKNNTNGKHTLAIRGSIEPWNDFIAGDARLRNQRGQARLTSGTSAI